MTTTAVGGLNTAIKAAWEAARSIEPALGKVSRAQVQSVRDALERVTAEMPAGLAGVDPSDRADLEGTLATVYARAATVAIAGGDEAIAHKWIGEAERLSHDTDQQHELAAARREPERYRTLVHGRNLVANGREGTARKLWKQLAKAGKADTLARAAVDELKAPRPITGSLPSLSRINGFGTGFYGSRDRWPDGSYTTTHCISAVWIPVIPIGAYRVKDSAGGYMVMAREQLSGFARFMRFGLAGAVVLAIAFGALSSYLNDPERLAKKHWDRALDVASTAQPEAALRALDEELASRDLDRVDTARREHAGAEVIRLSAGLVAKPFTADKLDQVNRTVRRFHALPESAQGGDARAAMVTALEGWITQLGDSLATADTHLALLRHELEISSDKSAVQDRITTTRIAFAKSRETEWPLDALEILVEEPRVPAAIAQATEIVGRLLESPSLLLDAGPDLEAWLAATPDEELRTRAASQRELAKIGKLEVEADGVTTAQLVAMQTKRQWDQRVALQLARNEASAGKLEAAAARIRKIGPEGMTIRDARFLLAQLVIAQGKLETGDEMLTGLLGTRLQRFITAGAALEEATKVVQARLKNELETGAVPPELEQKARNASDAEQRELIGTWMNEEIDADAAVIAKREVYFALGDVVPVSLAAGSVKLRRAQGMSGAARDAMLEQAEHMFLAIRTEAEGQPEFQLGLGEIYARLGKTKESEAQFAAVLAKNDPALSLRVAHVYRDIGSVERSRQVAKDVFDKAGSPNKENAAALLAVLSDRDDDEAEEWFRKADQTNPFVRTSLLEIEGGRLQRQGKHAECAAKFAAAAKAHLAGASAADTTGYNNAAVANQRRFACSGDISALAEAETMLERAYRLRADEPIVTGNLAGTLSANARVRVLAKRINVRVLRIDGGDTSSLFNALVRSSEHDAVLADLDADPAMRRSTELSAQFEVLAPNSATPYVERFHDATEHRDEAAAAGVVERARHAKAIDVSEEASRRVVWASGDSDAKYFEQAQSDIARLDEALATPKLDAKTRAAALFLEAHGLSGLGLYKGDVAILARARAAATQASKLWPALSTNDLVAETLLDQAGLEADSKSWIAVRRNRDAASALLKLTADHSPLADKVRASSQWGEALAEAKAESSRPGIAAVRFGALFGDPVLVARAKAAADDKIERLEVELDSLVAPRDEVTEDLALLGKH